MVNWTASGAVPVTRDAVKTDEFAAAVMEPTANADDIATAASFTRIAIMGDLARAPLPGMTGALPRARP